MITQFGILWPQGTLKILAVISTGVVMQFVQLLFTDRIVVWQPVDGRRSDRKM
jgi:hypothetical protein